MGGLVPYQRNVGDGSIPPWALAASHQKYTRCSYPGQGIFMPAAGVGNPSGTAQVENWGLIPAEVGGVLPVSYAAVATATILAPVFSSANGLDWAGDQTDNDGFEVVFGGLSARGKHAYTVGSGPKGTRGFFMKVTCSNGDADGTDLLMIGFRINAAFAAAATSYTDYAVFAVLTTASPMLIQTSCRKNNGTASTVSTTLTKADGISGAYEVYVDENGFVTFRLDGASPIVGGNLDFQLDAGDVMVPFAYLRHDTAIADNWRHTFFESGYNRGRAAA